MSAAPSGLNSGFLTQGSDSFVEPRRAQGLNDSYLRAARDAPRKPPQMQEALVGIRSIRATFERNRTATAMDIETLKRSYVFVDESVPAFLEQHRAMRTILQEAIEPLKSCFGADRIFNLEISREEDGSETLYAVAVWPGEVGRASEALRHFLETWWLHRMSLATVDLAFAYKLV